MFTFLLFLALAGQLRCSEAMCKQLPICECCECNRTLGVFNCTGRQINEVFFPGIDSAGFFFTWGETNGIPTLVLKNNTYTGVPKYNLVGPSVEILDLSYNQITSISENSLDFYPILSILYLNNNNIIGPIMTSHFDIKSLSLLHLQHNQLQSFTNDIVYDATNKCNNQGCSLETLNLGFNNFSIFSSDFFGYFPNLQTLDLSNNFLETLEMGWFARTTNISILNLSGNLVSMVNYSNTPLFSNLSFLDLSVNFIEELDQNLVQQLTNARFDVRSNRLANFDFLTNISFHNLSILAENNPWNCSCTFLETYQALINGNITFDCANGETDECIVCETPAEFAGLSVQNLSICAAATASTATNTTATDTEPEESSNLQLAALVALPILVIATATYRMYIMEKRKKVKKSNKKNVQITFIQVNQQSINSNGKTTQPEYVNSPSPKKRPTTPIPAPPIQSTPNLADEYVTMADQLTRRSETVTTLGGSVYTDGYLEVPAGQTIPRNHLTRTLPQRSKDTYYNTERPKHGRPYSNADMYNFADDVYEDIDQNLNVQTVQRDKSVYLRPFN